MSRPTTRQFEAELPSTGNPDLAYSQIRPISSTVQPAVPHFITPHTSQHYVTGDESLNPQYYFPPPPTVQYSAHNQPTVYHQSIHVPINQPTHVLPYAPVPFTLPTFQFHPQQLPPAAPPAPSFRIPAVGLPSLPHTSTGLTYFASPYPHHLARLQMVIPPLPPPPMLVNTWVRTNPVPFLPHVTSHIPLTYDHWLQGARARKTHYSHAFSVPPLRWVLKEEKEEFPQNALQTGTEESGEELYSIRTEFHGDLQLGKGGRHLFQGGSVPYESQEYAVSRFEVLVGDSSYANWIDFPHYQPSGSAFRRDSPTTSISPLTLTPLASPSDLPPLRAPISIEVTGDNRLPPPRIRPFYAMEGGFQSSRRDPNERRLILVAQAPYDYGWHPGKVEVGDDHASIGWGGGEVWARDYRLLIWDPPTRTHGRDEDD